MKRNLNYSLFRTSDLIAFTRKLLAFFDVETMEPGVLKSLVIKLSEVYQLFENGRQQERKNPLTEELKRLDVERGKAFNGLKYYVKSFVYSENTDEAKAAEKLMYCIKRYGWNAADMRYGKKSHALMMVLQEFAHKYTTETQLLGATSRIGFLQRTVDAFQQALTKQIQVWAAMPPSATSHRAALIAALRKVIGMVDAEADAYDDEVHKKLAEKVDALILDTMSPLKARRTRRENKKRLQTEASDDNPTEALDDAEA